ncbi:hypothetical protein cand_027250 [Cryptosporidium andersoni]|uniref:RING-type domain-containing protein n=1 Tax=Cryptosporidium andersoni TaxID=117008 RepID=A0A1J4MQ82_9CRYT|nr:hypothetical protein cand_027250 [Cryptosporidium andersoni]
MENILKEAIQLKINLQKSFNLIISTLNNTMQELNNLRIELKNVDIQNQNYVEFNSGNFIIQINNNYNINNKTKCKIEIFSNWTKSEIPSKIISQAYKNYFSELSKFGRLIEISFIDDIEIEEFLQKHNLYNTNIDDKLLADIISMHFIHSGYFDLNEIYCKEFSNYINKNKDKHQLVNKYIYSQNIVQAFKNLTQYIEEINNGDVDKALIWLESIFQNFQNYTNYVNKQTNNYLDNIVNELVNTEYLQKKKIKNNKNKLNQLKQILLQPYYLKYIELLYGLHEIKFCQIIENEDINSAIKYAKEKLSIHYKYKSHSIKRLILSLLFYYKNQTLTNNILNLNEKYPQLDQILSKKNYEEMSQSFRIIYSSIILLQDQTKSTESFHNKHINSIYLTNIRIQESNKKKIIKSPYLKQNIFNLDQLYNMWNKLPLNSPLTVILATGIIISPKILGYIITSNNNNNILPPLSFVLNQSSNIYSTNIIRTTILPIEFDLNKEFIFHSVLICTISKEPMIYPINPPIMLNCGHVICSKCLQKISTYKNQDFFKCPICPSKMLLSDTKPIFII